MLSSILTFTVIALFLHKPIKPQMILAPTPYPSLCFNSCSIFLSGETKIHGIWTHSSLPGAPTPPTPRILSLRGFRSPFKFRHNTLLSHILTFSFIVSQLSSYNLLKFSEITTQGNSSATVIGSPPRSVPPHSLSEPLSSKPPPFS